MLMIFLLIEGVLNFIIDFSTNERLIEKIKRCCSKIRHSFGNFHNKDAALVNILNKEAATLQSMRLTLNKWKKEEDYSAA